MTKSNLIFKLFIIALITGAIFTGCKDCVNASKKSKSTEKTTKSKDKTTPATVGVDEFKPEKLNYTPPTPEKGKLRGVVELGASGFNWFLVEIDKNNNWALKEAKYGEGESGIFENTATVKTVKTKLQAYIKSLLKTKVKGKDIHFIVSSGAEKEENTKKIIKALKGLKYVVNTVTPEQEGQYALSAVLPDEFKEKAFVVDMGSSNTKISYFEGDKVTGLETHGSKYFKKDIDPKTVYKEVRAEIAKVPANKRTYCFIIGGVPHEFAKQVRTGEERYTYLKSPGFYAPEKDKEIAGQNIYKAIVDESGTQTYIFDWDANFAIGFLKTLR